MIPRVGRIYSSGVIIIMGRSFLVLLESALKGLCCTLQNWLPDTNWIKTYSGAFLMASLRPNCGLQDKRVLMMSKWKMQTLWSRQISRLVHYAWHGRLPILTPLSHKSRRHRLSWSSDAAASSVVSSTSDQQHSAWSGDKREALEQSWVILWDQASRDAGQGEDYRFRRLLLMEEAVQLLKI